MRHPDAANLTNGTDGFVRLRAGCQIDLVNKLGRSTAPIRKRHFVAEALIVLDHLRLV